MSKVRLYGSTSGYIELAAPDVAPDSTLTLPALAGGFGKVAQVVQTVKTDTFTTTSTTFTAVTDVEVTITPSSSTSKILVVAFVNFSNETSGRSSHFRLARGGTGIFVGDATGSAVQSTMGSRIGASTAIYPGTIVYLDSPATTSATTYSIEARRGASTGAVYVNRAGNEGGDDADKGRTASSITAIEVAA